MGKPVTIKDIAARLGVSNMTVSGVLSNSQTFRVSDATRARVIATAREMQYRPNRAARSLRSSTTDVIGVYCSYGYLTPQAALTAQIIGGLHEGCAQNRKDLLLHGGYAGRSADDIRSELESGGIDGLILYTNPQDPLVDLLAETTLPVVAIVDALPGISSVVVDDISGVHLLARYLHKQGHRRILYRTDEPVSTSVVRREKAMRTIALELGIALEVQSPQLQGPEHESFTDAELAWLSGPRENRPTAVICWNDLTAYHLLDFCRTNQINVPRDIAVAGFDGLPSPRSTPWTLTTVRAPWIDVARTAVELLVGRIGGQVPPAETVLPVKLVAGDSA